jgi:two-component system, chemotaxis family, protein-glutamate methylesterase/glutaminase
MNFPPVRVLVVDDSAFARKVLREALSANARIEVVGTARDGLEALEKIAELSPDVVTLDLVMPNLDGLGVLRALPPGGATRVVVVSVSDADSERGVEALQSGAVQVVHKPTALATDRLYELGSELVRAVLAAAQARPGPLAAVAERRLAAVAHVQTGIVVVGTSTGGPQALTRLLSALPADFPVPVAVVLHIPVGYTEPMARRLDGVCAVEVREAAEGLELRPGRVILARAGTHLKLARQQGATVARLDGDPASSPHRPSVDVLFASAAAQYGPAALGVVLTGMGDDGLVGSRAIHARGGRLLTESESSSIVYGMPRSVWEAGLAEAQAPLEEMAALILRHL